MLTCIHVGAHHAEEEYPAYTVHWVEADPVQWEKYPHFLRFAAMDYDGTVLLHRRNVSMACSVRPLAAWEHDFAGKPLTIIDDVVVPCYKLDTAFVAVERVALLVIDVEGAELYVLRGACELLKRTDEVKVELLAQPGYPTRDQYDELLAEFTLMEVCPGHDGYWSDLRYRRL